MKSIKVLIVDDHRIIREGLRRMLYGDNRIEVAAVASSGEEAVVLASRVRPDVILMDIRMPGIGGIEAIRQIKAKRSESSIVVLTIYEDEQHLREAVEAGAIGYLLKDVNKQELHEAIKQAYSGQSPIASSMTRSVFKQIATSSRGTQKRALSERQMEILRLIARGMTNKDIAGMLFLSAATIKREMNKIFTELNAGDRAEAVARAYEQKLLGG